MNEQFHRLVNQAIQECKPDDNPSKERTLQRYGELIIQECVTELLKWDNEPFPMDPKHAARVIKEHFGIK